MAGDGRGLHVGDVAKVRAVLRDLDTGLLVDPAVVVFKVKPPGSQTVEYSGSAVMREAVGKYRVDVACTASGNWRAVLQTTAPAVAVEPIEFYVAPTGV